MHPSFETSQIRDGAVDGDITVVYEDGLGA